MNQEESSNNANASTTHPYKHRGTANTTNNVNNATASPYNPQAGMYHPYSSSTAAGYAAPYAHTAAAAYPTYGYVPATFHPMQYAPAPQWQPQGMGYGTSSPAAAAAARPPSSLQAQASAYVPRKKSPLVITDRDGKPLDLTNVAKSSNSSSLQRAADEEREKKERELAEIAKNEEAKQLAQRKAEEEEKAAVAAKQLKLKLEQEQDQIQKEQEKARLAAEAQEELKLIQQKKEEVEAAAAAEQKRLVLEPQPNHQELKAKAEADADADADADTEASHKFEEQPLRPGGRVAMMNEPCRVCRRQIYSKSALMSFRDLEISLQRPVSLPDMTTVLKGDGGGGREGGKNSSERGGGGGAMRRNSSSEWSRGNRQLNNNSTSSNNNAMRRQGSSVNNHNNGNVNVGNQGGGGGEWSRGHAPPPKKPHKNKNGNNNNGNNPPALFDGPITPLVRSANRWRPTPNTNDVIVMEKKAKSILNKMTKEKFTKLSNQMLELPIGSAQVLETLIKTIFDKAMEEPNFGDMYADLCVLLSTQIQCEEFVKVIEGYERVSQVLQSQSSHSLSNSNTAGATNNSNVSYYQWSADVHTKDETLAGPYHEVNDIFKAAFPTEEDPNKDEELLFHPRKEGLELSLYKVMIVQNTFFKIMTTADNAEFYAVFFPLEENEEDDNVDAKQQLSQETFMSYKDCLTHAKKVNSFRRLLLNKCQDEFSKQDIYADLQREINERKLQASANANSSASLDDEALGEELEFKRIQIKKLMLGNIRFIGELFKKHMLRESVIHECIWSLLKLKNQSSVKGVYDIIDLEASDNNKNGNNSMEEEDHEALCQLLTSVGKTLDTPNNAKVMSSYFQKISALSKFSSNTSLSSRSRFLYQDLIELRQNNWRLRRKEESAMTLQEIKKEFEKEERAAARLSAAANARGGGNDYHHRNHNRGERGGNNNNNNNNNRRMSNSTSLSRSANSNSSNPTMVLSRNSNSSNNNHNNMNSPMMRSNKGANNTNSNNNRRNYNSNGSTNQHYGNSNNNSNSAKKQVAVATALSPDQFKNRIKTIRLEYAENNHNDSDLLLSVEKELTATSDWTVLLSTQYLETALECKQKEREVIIRIFEVLCEKQMLGKSDFVSALKDLLEFMNDFVIDIPQAYENMGTILASLIGKCCHVIGLSDLMSICTQLGSEAVNGSKLVCKTLTCMKDSYGKDAVQSAIVAVGGGTTNTVQEFIADEVLWKSIMSK